MSKVDEWKKYSCCGFDAIKTKQAEFGMSLLHLQIPRTYTTNKIENPRCTRIATTHTPQLCAADIALLRAARNPQHKSVPTRSADRAQTEHEEGHAPPTQIKYHSELEVACVKDEEARCRESDTQKQNTPTKTKNTARQMRQRGWRYNRQFRTRGQCRTLPGGTQEISLKA